MDFRKQVCFSVVVLMLFLSATAYCAERTVIKPRSASDPKALPFSGAVMVGETLYLSGDIGLYDAFNSVYRTYFTKEFPARAFIGAGKLLFDARFEVQAIAVKR